MFRKASKSSVTLLKQSADLFSSSNKVAGLQRYWQAIGFLDFKQFASTASAAGTEGQLEEDIAGRLLKLDRNKGKRATSRTSASSRLKRRPIKDVSTIKFNLEQSTLQPRSRRTGLVAVKAGMTQDWDEWGKLVPLTVLWIDECQVVQVKTAEKDGFNSLQLGIGSKRDKQLPGSLLGHFSAAGVPNKRRMVEFPVSPNALLPPGTAITANHFTAGQYVDVQGTTIGKGFQGVMKKWNFAGQPRSHGNSKAHRLAGSTGQCQDPGKVFPGKKMAGRMGGETRTVMNALVFKVDPIRNLLYVRGQVPGHKGNFVVVKDAALKKYDLQPGRPFPTCLEAVGLNAGVTCAPKTEISPFEPRER